MKKKKEATHRIPYESWRNSQLSVVRFYGQCKLNGKTYILDPDAPVSVIDGQEMFSPDLITYE